MSMTRVRTYQLSMSASSRACIGSEMYRARPPCKSKRCTLQCLHFSAYVSAVCHSTKKHAFVMGLKIYKLFLGNEIVGIQKLYVTKRGSYYLPASYIQRQWHNPSRNRDEKRSSLYSLFSPLPLSCRWSPLLSFIIFPRARLEKKNLPSRSCTSVVRGGADETTSRWFVPSCCQREIPNRFQKKGDRPLLCKSWNTSSLFFPSHPRCCCSSPPCSWHRSCLWPPPSLEEEEEAAASAPPCSSPCAAGTGGPTATPARPGAEEER